MPKLPNMLRSIVLAIRDYSLHNRSDRPSVQASPILTDSGPCSHSFSRLNPNLITVRPAKSGYGAGFPIDLEARPPEFSSTGKCSSPTHGNDFPEHRDAKWAEQAPAQSSLERAGPVSQVQPSGSTGTWPTYLPGQKRRCRPERERAKVQRNAREMIKLIPFLQSLTLANGVHDV